MTAAPQKSIPTIDGPDNIEAISLPAAQAPAQHESQTETKRCPEKSLTQSRPNSSSTIPPQPITMPDSIDSIQPLTHSSEKTSNDMLPIRPDPIHVRSARSSYDTEKQDYYSQAGLTPGFTPTNWPVSSPSQPSTATTEWNCEYVPEEMPMYENHLGVILVHLSLVSTLVAGLLSIYTIATAIFLAILAPLSLCTSQPPFQRSFISSVSPVIRLQLRMIYSEPEFPTAVSVGHLACTAIFAPFFAVVITFAAWVAAAFWCYAAILGEPNERQGEEQDGRAAIRAVRSIWERWLLWGLH